MTADFWKDPARVLILTTGWSENMRAALIAEAIGDGCTRNMVIGKARRLDLPRVIASERNKRIGEGNRAAYDRRLTTQRAASIARKRRQRKGRK